MPKIALSDTGLRSIKPPEKGAADYWDANFPSFGVRVSQGGTKTFVLNIGKTRRPIGRFGVLSLAEARTEARRILAERTLGKARPQSVTFQTALDEFLAEKQKTRRSRTVDNLKDRLRLHFSFNCSELLRRLTKIDTNAEHDHALSVAKTFFTWAHNRRYIDDNPTRGISPRGTQSRARVLTDEELVRIWRACEQRAAKDKAYAPSLAVAEHMNGVTNRHMSATDTEPCNSEHSSLPANFARIVQLLLLTGQRRNEIASLQHSWIKNDLVTFPSSVTKNGREHSLPIPSLAKSVIGDIGSDVTTAATTASPYMFRAKGNPSAPFSGWSKSKAALDKKSGVTDWTLHDCRRSYRTIHARIGTPPHIAERLVNHVSSRSQVEAIYDRHTYADEMRAAVDRFEEWFAALIK
jgi:integrase